jgi:hypothetical protein
MDSRASLDAAMNTIAFVTDTHVTSAIQPIATYWPKYFGSLH